jgi:hypothetical protein
MLGQQGQSREARPTGTSLGVGFDPYGWIWIPAMNEEFTSGCRLGHRQVNSVEDVDEMGVACLG